MEYYTMDNPNQEPSNEAMDINEAASAFNSIFEPQLEAAEVTETPEQLAEKLIVEEQEAERTPNVAEEGADGTQLIPLEIDGKVIELTKEQLAEAYKNGLRQQDYTRKTMELSEQRKAAEAEKTSLKEERSKYAEKLNNDLILMDGMLQEQSKINWKELLATDPVEYLKQDRIFRERQAEFQKSQQELVKIQQLHQVEQAKQQADYISKQQEELLAKLPDWKDPVKAKTEKEQLRAYLADKHGFTEERIASIQDHQAVILLRKAMQYDALMERATTAKTKVQSLPPKVERPGNGVNANKDDAQTRAINRFQKSGRVEDAAAVFSTMF
jgi:hypothetical protein